MKLLNGKKNDRPSSESTPDNLVEINEDNGVITVKEGALIDCDGDPKIYDLVYTVSLNDSLWQTDGEVSENLNNFVSLLKYTLQNR